ncbi:glycosyltransferase family 1 protein [Paenibacillus sp. H1-7]|uniref:glycosyltransferase family 4 protein n=1 Tax=Paenibacillus sp. H1-7 TaxID=2282849 RepID=UPI001EF761BD|nr:glycosyltransferase family 4 protein [Paenibacillus sp. H1-7]ULL13903.1 glycosyltransferase family 1 protein [Paenibacillus sp. H1-7]
MPKKVLFCATVDYHFRAFHLPYMKWFKEQGWDVHVAASGDIELPYVDQKFNLPFQRSPLKLQNVKVYQQLKSILDEHYYELIHCHTPMGGMLARLAARKTRKQGTRVLYTAHGFHFCKGGPALNWLLYYPIEKWLSAHTDTLITINEEDYRLAVQHRFKAGRIAHVHGVGVDTERFKPADESARREARLLLGYHPGDFLMFYAAEFNKNKNQQLLIQALARIKAEVPHARLLLAGSGSMQEDCRQLARELGVEEMIDFLGYRKDIDTLLPLCDVAVASSLREGLPVNILEAMACGLPVVVSANRGHSELIADGVNGFIVQPTDSESFAERLLELSRSLQLSHKLGLASRNRVQGYSLTQVGSEMTGIYSDYFLGDTDEAESKYSRAYI